MLEPIQNKMMDDLIQETISEVHNNLPEPFGDPRKEAFVILASAWMREMIQMTDKLPSGVMRLEFHRRDANYLRRLVELVPL